MEKISEILGEILDDILSLEILTIILMLLFLLIGKQYTSKILFDRIINQNYYEGIYYSDEVDPFYLERIAASLYKNGLVYESYKNDKGIIYYTSTYECYFGQNNFVSGQFSKYFLDNKPLIQLKTGFEESIEKTISHELGHYMDFKLGMISLRPKFYKLYKKYKDIDFNDYGILENDTYIKKNLKEFFAERYSDYILYPDILREIEPEIYEYIDSCYKEVLADENNI